MSALSDRRPCICCGEGWTHAPPAVVDELVQSVRHGMAQFRSSPQFVGKNVSLRSLLTLHFTQRSPRWMSVEGGTADVLSPYILQMQDRISVGRLPASFANCRYRRRGRGERLVWAGCGPPHPRHRDRFGRQVWAQRSLAAVRHADSHPTSSSADLPDLRRACKLGWPERRQCAGSGICKLNKLTQFGAISRRDAARGS